jgi:uncharacterized protein (DUF58 family)
MPPEDEQFIDESFLRKLERLKLLTRRGVKGPQRGEHIAWRSGASLEFLDYRKYHIGDDFRYVDWNVYGRLDKLFIKLFRAEESQTIHMLLDTSRSMGFGTPAKALAAKKITAALSYLCLANQDRVTLTAFAERLGAFLSTAKSTGSYPAVMRFLRGIGTGGVTDFDGCLSAYAMRTRRAGVAVILSDLMVPDGFEEGLEALRYRKFDINVIQILDSTELAPDFHGKLRLKEIETGEVESISVDEEILAIYQKVLQGFIEGKRNYCQQRGVNYYLFDTAMPFENFIIAFLTRRLVT